MGRKFFCWDMDDGLEQDRRVTELLRRYGMGGTFHLNPGLLGLRQMTRWENDRPLEEVSLEAWRQLPGQYVRHFRVPEAEAADVYRGFEVAAHGFLHRNVALLSREALQADIAAEQAAFLRLFGRQARGYAYPYGVSTGEAVRCLEQAGIRYARITQIADSFAVPRDLLRLPIHGRPNRADVFRRLDAFFRAEAEEDLIFIMFAHGYEFDFQTPLSSWQRLEEICGLVASHPEICCCSVGEALGVCEQKKPERL